MIKIFSLILIKTIRLYQFFSSFFPPKCRFHPSCSNYMLQAVTKYGFFKGLFLGTIRIFKCHPFHPGGYDPLK